VKEKHHANTGASSSQSTNMREVSGILAPPAPRKKASSFQPGPMSYASGTQTVNEQWGEKLKRIEFQRIVKKFVDNPSQLTTAETFYVAAAMLSDDARTLIEHSEYSEHMKRTFYGKWGFGGDIDVICGEIRQIIEGVHIFDSHQNKYCLMQGTTCSGALKMIGRESLHIVKDIY
ncbi:unnamed protein product, partial [Amoebophrya sp. A25]